jgi:hypothetical protein
MDSSVGSHPRWMQSARREMSCLIRWIVLTEGKT